MAIFLIRHGETASNHLKIVQYPEEPLSERGLHQADRLGERLSALGVERILSSDYRRAHMTAERLAARTGARIDLETTLRERNYGIYRGRPHTELGDLMFDDSFEPPEGEGWPAFHARVARAWARVTAVVGGLRGNLAVVTHGLVCYSLSLHQLRLPDGPGPARGFGNTSLTVVEAADPWRVTLLNDTAHLDGLELEARGLPGG